MTCDHCNRREFSEGDDSYADLSANAQYHGWTFKKVQNGSFWDICPECSKLDEYNTINEKGN